MTSDTSAINFINHLIDSDPQKTLRVLESLSAQDAADIIKSLSIADAIECLENIQPRYGAAIMEELDSDYAASIIHKLTPQQTASMFRFFAATSKKKFLNFLDIALSIKIGEILNYPNESAGRVMQPNFLSFRSDIRVREVINKLRSLARSHVPTTYCYVVNHENKLIGILNMRDLIISDLNQFIEDIMKKDVIKVSPFTDREELIAIFGEKHYLGIPVVDEDNRLIGVVNTKDLIESTEEEASEDIQILFGASPEERVYSPLSFKIRKRLPWLYINLLTAFLAGAVVAVFEGMISKVAVLAVFLPIIAGQGGNAGTQSLSVILRALVMREIKPSAAYKAVLVETSANLINGIGIGIVTAGVAWAWKGNPYLGLIVGVAMFINMTAAGLAGAFIPLTMKKMGFDPAHSSGIFLTTITDIVGFFSFLGLAWLFLDKLI
ncbi:MAG: magnesium transporter [Elusimicrobiales bacterium]|nr:magnesium transporter [Elusimicrobiales bacterium]